MKIEHVHEKTSKRGRPTRQRPSWSSWTSSSPGPRAVAARRRLPPPICVSFLTRISSTFHVKPDSGTIESSNTLEQSVSWRIQKHSPSSQSQSTRKSTHPLSLKHQSQTVVPVPWSLAVALAARKGVQRRTLDRARLALEPLQRGGLCRQISFTHKNAPLLVSSLRFGA